MAQIYSAFASDVKVTPTGGKPETIEGLQSIEYSMDKNQQQVGAIGTDERIAVYFGLKIVNGKLSVASANATLDDLLQKNTEFSVSATLTHKDAKRTVTLDSCYMEDKTFGMSAQGHGETTYVFTATRVREE